MRGRDLADLLLLAAAWGGSFLFIRVAVPEFGIFPLMTLRVGLATLWLLPLLILGRKVAEVLKHRRALFITGILNAVLPFTLFAYGAYDLGVGFLAVANAVTPAWGGVIGWLWLKDRLPRSSWMGLALGFIGMLDWSGTS
jgi:drug/metabolite transporter (DMT)-like permease